MHFRSSTEQNILQNNQFQYKHQVNQIKNKKHKTQNIHVEPSESIPIDFSVRFDVFRN